jgi:hypothetical protein
MKARSEHVDRNERCFLVSSAIQLRHVFFSDRSLCSDTYPPSPHLPHPHTLLTDAQHGWETFTYHGYINVAQCIIAQSLYVPASKVISSTTSRDSYRHQSRNGFTNTNSPGFVVLQPFSLSARAACCFLHGLSETPSI